MEPYEKDKSEEDSLAVVVHILGLLTWILGPMIVYLISDDEFVKENAGMALSWQLYFTLYNLLSVILLFFAVGFVFLALLPFINIVFCSIGAIKASDGKVWRYPLTTNLLKSSTNKKEIYPGKNPMNNKKNRIDELKAKRKNGEISEEEFERKLDEYLSEDNKSKKQKDVSKDFNY